MKQTLIFIILIVVFSCSNSKQPEKEIAKQIDNKETEINTSDTSDKNSRNDSLFNSVREKLLNDIIIHPETYKSKSWSNVEIMKNPIFKYRISHTFSCAGLNSQPWDNVTELKFKPTKNEIKEYEIFFHLDSTRKVVTSSLIENYRNNYNENGQLRTCYTNFEFEKIGKDNKIHMLLHSENSKTLTVVSNSIPFFKGKIGMTKMEFLRNNFQKLERNILVDIDKVYFSDYESGGNAIQFIFKNDTLVEIK
jgi:hypothetical protein